ncbi:hypothetical protein AN214_02248 [Pseudoalteromonas sp. P1-9]|nr:hypothetical protein AN214_02248 [Pseudoalteromonas sp. P1-9]
MTALVSGCFILLDVDFLQHSNEIFWHVPYRSFVIMLCLVAVACSAKLIARPTFLQQSIANIGLYAALSWFPVSLIFSGNVRNIFSASSLVSYDVWLMFSLLPLVSAIVISLMFVYQKIFSN